MPDNNTQAALLQNMIQNALSYQQQHGRIRRRDIRRIERAQDFGQLIGSDSGMGNGAYADSPQLLKGPKSSFWSGSKGGFQNAPIYTQPQTNALNDILSQALQMYNNPYDNPFVQESVRHFNSEILPSIASRFAHLGAHKSSSYQHALTSAGTNLQRQLAAQSWQQTLPLLQLGLSPRYQTAYHEPSRGAGPSLTKAGIAAGAAGLGAAATGGWSAIIPAVLAAFGGSVGSDQSFY